ncbi:hypothetical protein WME76_24715 [Sorangium sp. So ce119]|uniref:hypothetical protein n=2 Tax=unclassified Sorangium TaxID=2621164 RepID=UPI003F5E95FC
MATKDRRARKQAPEGGRRLPVTPGPRRGRREPAALPDTICKGRMKLVAMVTEPRNIARFLSALGEPTDVPARSPSVHAAATVLEKHRSAPQGAR